LPSLVVPPDSARPIHGSGGSAYADHVLGQPVTGLSYIVTPCTYAVRRAGDGAGTQCQGEL